MGYETMPLKLKIRGNEQQAHDALAKWGIAPIIVMPGELLTEVTAVATEQNIERAGKWYLDGTDKEAAREAGVLISYSVYKGRSQP